MGLFAVSLLMWIAFEKSHWLRRGVDDNGDKATAEPVLVGAHAAGDEVGAHTAAEPATTAIAAPPKWLVVGRMVLVVLALVVSVGSVVDVALIGDAGAQAAWHDGFSVNPLPRTASGH